MKIGNFDLNKDDFIIKGGTLWDGKKTSRQFSKSLYMSKEIKKGEVFTQENIKSVRPGYGMHPKYLKDILGTTAKKDFYFGSRLSR